jgi:glycosyltransferase involved in cell wall biosynthesis
MTQVSRPDDDVIVLIPAYNEAASIRDLVERALQIIPNVVVVDDGSSDATATRIADLPIVLLRNQRNLGKAASLWKGFEHAIARGARYVVTLDGDGQHRPEDIGRLLAAAGRHPGTIVIGARLHDKQNFPLHRYYANQIARFWISWAAGYPIADTQSGFRVYPVELLTRLKPHEVSRKRFVLESEILIACGRRGVRSVAVQIPGIYPVNARPSHFMPVRDFTRIALMVVGRLLVRGMYPGGLWRSLTLRAAVDDMPATKEIAGNMRDDATADRAVVPPRPTAR